MARKQKIQALPPPPEGSGIEPFNPRFTERLSRNFELGIVVHGRLEALRAHVGGDPSASMESLIRRTVWLELVCAYYEQRFAEGRLDRDGHAIWTQCTNTLRGFLKDIGLERHQRPVRSLRDVMNGKVAAA
jgi:hypothetical protein